MKRGVEEAALVSGPPMARAGSGLADGNVLEPPFVVEGEFAPWRLRLARGLPAFEEDGGEQLVKKGYDLAAPPVQRCASAVRT